MDRFRNDIGKSSFLKFQHDVLNFRILWDSHDYYIVKIGLEIDADK